MRDGLEPDAGIRTRALRDLGVRVLVLGAVFVVAGLVLSSICTMSLISPYGETCIATGFGVWQFVMSVGIGLLTIGGVAFYHASRVLFYEDSLTPPSAQPEAHYCHRCGKPLVWVSEHSRWYCSTCAEYRG